MPTHPITRDDADSMRDTTAEFMQYMAGVIDYLQKHGYVPDDKLMRDAIAARNAAQAFHMAAHYESCSGVGKGER